MNDTEMKPGFAPVLGSRRERPILFSGPMIRAILAGRKTQTRRVAKTKGIDCLGPCGNSVTGDAFLAGRDWVGNSVSIKCPYGAPGDRLWVRETWRPQDGMTLEYQIKDEIEYRATDDRPKEPTDCHWKPSIFMPRWASRITLEIVAVRVERLKDISNEDCFAEGLPPETMKGNRTWFGDLWEEINGKGSWDLNPWVWVVQFKAVNAPSSATTGGAA